MPGMTVSPAEVARFDALAARWWDPNGPMRPLHRMNPARVAWIVERIGAPPPPPNPLPRGDGGGSRFGRVLQLLPAACVCLTWAVAPEWRPRRWRAAASTCWAWTPPARRSRRRVPTPRGRTCRSPTASVSPRTCWPRARGSRSITALEVIEHVPDPAAFLATLAALLAPGGQAVPLHPQPHAAVIPRRQGRRRVPAALAADRHA